MRLQTLQPTTAPPSARASPPARPKLRIGPVDDPLEREADRAADAILAGQPVGAIGGGAAMTAQRKCAECEKEDPVRRAAAARPDRSIEPEAAGHAASAVARGGAPLTADERAYFEPRFGRDLSYVRLHTQGPAAEASRTINARAFAVGPQIGFAPGEYRPAAPEGRRLLAHELAHVVQQSSAPQTAIRRTVAPSSLCPANAASAPADPIAELQAADAEAQRMALGAALLLSFEALNFRHPVFGASYVSAAYRRRFGTPGPAPGGRFRNRFNNGILATSGEAEAAEMMSLSDRFARQNAFLARNVRYRCPGTALFSVGGCTNRCGTSFAWTCAPTDARTIVICPAFWGLSAPQKAAVLVHESIHMRLNFVPEASATAGQRGRNAECYASLILDLYGQGVSAALQPQFATVDPSCPPI